MKKTPEFWTKYVVPKVSNEFWGLYRFLNKPYPNGPNWYLQRVEGNIQKLRQQLSPANTA